MLNCRRRPAAAAGLLLLHLAAARVCRDQLLQAVPSANGVEQWIDVDSPAEACTKDLPGFDAQYQVGSWAAPLCCLFHCRCRHRPPGLLLLLPDHPSFVFSPL